MVKLIERGLLCWFKNHGQFIEFEITTKPEFQNFVIILEEIVRIIDTTNRYQTAYNFLALYTSIAGATKYIPRFSRIKEIPYPITFSSESTST